MFKKKVLTTAEVLVYLNITRSTLYRWKEERGFPAPLAGKTKPLSYNKVEIDLWLSKERKSA